MYTYSFVSKLFVQNTEIYPLYERDEPITQAGYDVRGPSFCYMKRTERSS